MGEIFKNRIFFVAFFLWNLILGLFLLLFEKGDAVLFFNQFYDGYTEILFGYLTQFGEIYAGIIVGLILFVFKRKTNFWPFLVSIIANLLVIYLLKHKMFQNYDRPFAMFGSQINYHPFLKINKQFSFPSGHTSAAFVFFTHMAIAFNKHRFSWFLFFIPALVGISRVFLAQHFMIDVFFGAWVGFALTLFSYFGFYICRR